MKFKLLVITITLAFSSGYSGVGIGVKGGLALYRAENNRSLNFYNEYKPASDISIFCELKTKKMFFHNIMLTYYQAGGKTTFLDTDVWGIINDVELWDIEKLDYVGLGYGLGLKIKLLNILPYVSAGVSLDYLISNKKERRTGKTVIVNHYINDLKFKKFNIRPFLSAGLEYKISIISLLAEYTFSYGVLPYFVQEDTPISDDIKYKTFGHFINLGCKLSI